MRLDRLNDMEQYILKEGTVSLENLSNHYQVSVNTIRRDLNEVIARGRIRKVYGGVSAVSEEGLIPMTIRANRNKDAKQEIGQMAAELVNDGDTIFLDSGSTVQCIIPHISHKHNITIVTHSLSVMYEASKYPTLQIIALGGLYNHSTSSYVGFSTQEALSNISTNAVFMAATGVSLERGLTNTTYLEAEIKRKVVKKKKKVILMADQSKFDYSSTITFFNFEDLYAVVTDSKPSSKYLDAIQKNGIQLIYKK